MARGLRLIKALADAIVLGVGAAVGENHQLQLEQDDVAVVLEVGAVGVGVAADIIDVGAVCDWKSEIAY